MADPKLCTRCGDEITKPPHVNRKEWAARRWCSNACRFANVARETKVCQYCGLEYSRAKERGTDTFRRSKYCGETCRRQGISSKSNRNVAEALWLLESGEWPPRIAERLGVPMATLRTGLRRAGHMKASLKFEDRYLGEVA